ncbi:hypothetical protein PPYR_02371 [Photinus pyralis]|uniref:Uncharacterized protein n=1 Tax=Photinus pyralis TaxID=7054 RepID=A0A5N4B716_PHOPY|nr:hypothetical protein PPYR_02369 [Photinus pyralis]KAB0805401.1 hypothetical protein PPYR_02371 [Photinus pyralis]
MEYLGMRPVDLLAEELNYELRIRGVVSDRKDAVTKRKILNKLLEKDRNRSNVTHVDPLYDFDNEAEIIEQALDSLKTLIVEFDGTETDSLFKRINSRILYLTNRVHRLKTDGDDSQVVQAFKNESIASILELEVCLSDKVVANSTLGNVNHTAHASSSNEQPMTIQHCVNNYNKSVPVYKWGLKFSGKEGSSLLSIIPRTSRRLPGGKERYQNRII